MNRENQHPEPRGELEDDRLEEVEGGAKRLFVGNLPAGRTRDGGVVVADPGSGITAPG